METLISCLLRFGYVYQANRIVDQIYRSKDPDFDILSRCYADIGSFFDYKACFTSTSEVFGYDSHKLGTDRKVPSINDNQIETFLGHICCFHENCFESLHSFLKASETETLENLLHYAEDFFGETKSFQYVIDFLAYNLGKKYLKINLLEKSVEMSRRFKTRNSLYHSLAARILAHADEAPQKILAFYLKATTLEPSHLKSKV